MSEALLMLQKTALIFFSSLAFPFLFYFHYYFFFGFYCSLSVFFSSSKERTFVSCELKIISYSCRSFFYFFYAYMYIIFFDFFIFVIYFELVFHHALIKNCFTHKTFFISNTLRVFFIFLISYPPP